MKYRLDILARGPGLLPLRRRLLSLGLGLVVQICISPAGAAWALSIYGDDWVLLRAIARKLKPWPGLEVSQLRRAGG